MLKIKGTVLEYDKLMENFDGVFEETMEAINEIDISDKTKEHLIDMVNKDLGIIYTKIFNLLEVEE